MASAETTTGTPASTQPGETVCPSIAENVPLSRFDQMVERMKGTGRIVGDIISPAAEIWNCEVE
jgi:hypothetical protein